MVRARSPRAPTSAPVSASVKVLPSPRATILGCAAAVAATGLAIRSTFNLHSPTSDRDGLEPAEQHVLEQIAEDTDQHDSAVDDIHRSEEHTSELQSLMRISYAVFCLKKKK